MSEGQEATGTQPGKKQETSGQCTSINKPKKSKKNRKHNKNSSKKKVTHFEKYQDFKFPDDEKPIEVDGKKLADNPGGGSEELAEEGAMMLDENAGAYKPDDENSFVRNAQNFAGGTNTDDLPSDWIKFQHINDVTIYMHKPTSVCTLSKPYVPQKGKIKTQNIPAIPCLAYKYAFEDTEKQYEIDKVMFEDFKKPETCHHSETNTKYKDVETKNSNVNRTDQIKPAVNIPNKIDDQLNIDWSEMMATVSESSLFNTVASNKVATRKETNEFKKIVLEEDESLELNDLLLFASSLSSVPIEMDYSEENACDNFTKNYKTWNEAEYSGKLNYATPASQQTLFMSDNMMEYDSEDTCDDLLSAEQIAEYCKKLFKFKMIKQGYKNWTDRLNFEKEKKALQHSKPSQGQSSSTPLNKDGDYKAVIEHTMLNANETNFMTMFHDFVFIELQREPIYIIKEIFPDSGSEEGVYQATVYINNKRYGVGQGLNKRQAKYAAGRATVPMLMSDEEHVNTTSEIDANFFDYVSIDDPSVLDYTATAIAMSPYAVLLTYQRENHGDDVKITMKRVANQRIEITMTVGHLATTVICENKFTAMHRAAQNILQALHPEIRSWGSLLCLHAIQSMEKQLEEMQASKGAHGKSNRAMEKIQKEIMKLRKRREAAANAIMMQTGHSKYFSIVESVTF